ncbi:antigen 5 like allergen Cul n 1 [Drosophila mojavensis]|nr:antigen 5 like allergen Cul n 1 [Drosophila mojavensis]
MTARGITWLLVSAMALSCLLEGSRAGEPDYCKLCAKGVQHIACGNNESFSEECPADAKLLAIGEDAQQAVVAAHNEVREQWASGRGHVKVKACRMATVRWDAELARLAELNVKQCYMEHDACHNTEKFRYSGQNLFIEGYWGMAAPDISTILRYAVEEWAKEGKDVKAAHLAKYPNNYNGPTIGHLTMVAHERSIAVGCAVANFLKDEFNTFLVACNYATTNFIGWPVYTTCKKVGEKCKSGMNPNYPSLCSINEDVDCNFGDRG